MSQRENGNAGPLAQFLTEDHRRLDALWRSTLASGEHIDHEAYARFRAGLLRHIGMEEKILLPVIQRLRGGETLPIASRLRLDHGALAALLMPTPTAAIMAKIHDVLTQHNALEEGPDGWYQLADELAASEAESLRARLRAAPEVKVLPYSDGAAVKQAVRRALERAGYGGEGL